jgi:hypothetical protein
MLHITVWAARFIRTSDTLTVYVPWFYPLNVIGAIAAIGCTSVSRAIGAMLRSLSVVLMTLVSMISMLSTLSAKATASLMSSIAWLSSVRSPIQQQTTHRYGSIGLCKLSVLVCDSWM